MCTKAAAGTGWAHIRAATILAVSAWPSWATTLGHCPATQP
ncbi:hypothetical protein LEMLEM_LOCUS12159 [Lemmus lemmus]